MSYPEATGSNQPESIGLSESAAWAGHHRYVERELFALTGRWSTELSGPADASASVVLATQSELHGWRLAQWESRSPRSVETTETPLRSGWVEALSAADGANSIWERLACWVSILAPALAADYRTHQELCTGPADRGTRRWVGIALEDLLGGVADGGMVLARRDRSDVGDLGEAVATAARALL